METNALDDRLLLLAHPSCTTTITFQAPTRDAGIVHDELSLRGCFERQLPLKYDAVNNLRRAAAIGPGVATLSHGQDGIKYFGMSTSNQEQNTLNVHLSLIDSLNVFHGVKMQT